MDGYNIGTNYYRRSKAIARTRYIRGNYEYLKFNVYVAMIELGIPLATPIILNNLKAENLAGIKPTKPN